MNKIDEIKEALAAATPGPWGWLETVTKCSLGECHRLSLWTTESADMELTQNDYKFAAKAPEYITYLLAEIERKDEALEFYEDKNNYIAYYEDENDPFSLMPEKVVQDGGQRAREAL